MYKLFFNADIRTMDNSAPRASAAVCIGEYFAFTGDEAGARQFLRSFPGQPFETIDCAGRLMLPGFNDSHMHYLHYAKAKLSVDLFGARSISDVLQRMRSGLEEYNPESGLWLTGEGWNQDLFDDEKRFPTADDLDKITTEYPVFIMRACFHIGVLNSKAMQLLGIDSERVKLYGSFAETRADGTPNGVLKENVLDDIKANLPAPSLETLTEMMIDAQRDMFACGVTSVQTDDFKYVPEGRAHEMMHLLRAASESGRLKLRIAEQALLTEPEAMDAFFRAGFDGRFDASRFKISSVKILADGSLGARTAFMRKPYADDPSTKGLPIYKTQQQLDNLVLEAHKRNMAAIIHAIGDGAVEMCLDTIERAKREMPHLCPRHGIVHCQITDMKQLERFKELDVVAYTQPIFLDYDMHIVASRVGSELAGTSYAFRTLTDLGVHQAFGTDCPVEGFNPLPGIYCAVTRKDLSGRGPYLPQQALTVEQAVHHYTAAGAYCTHEEHCKGKISAGYYADLIILDTNIFEIPPEKILSANVLSTYIGGELVYSAEK